MYSQTFFTDVLKKGLIFPHQVAFCCICATGEISLPVLETQQKKKKSPQGEVKVTKVLPLHTL